MIDLISHYPELAPIMSSIDDTVSILHDCYEKKGLIMMCGNGGSASDSAHISGELLKGFMLKRETDFKVEGVSLQKGIPCIDLTNNSTLISAFSNDVDPDSIFAQLVYAYSEMNRNNVLICLSTSGNSKNVVNAAKVAKALGLKVISFTGEKDSILSLISDITLKVPSSETYRVQEYHLPIYHYICAKLEEIVCK